VSWQERARDAAMTGFTFEALVAEIVGRSSTLMAGDRVFDEREANQVVVEALIAIQEFIRVAINQQSIDAQTGMADWQIVELIAQAPAWFRSEPEP
jgi:hypothetical protein